jgi:hypothetical protein
MITQQQYIEIVRELVIFFNMASDDNVTVFPPKTPEHIYPVISFAAPFDMATIAILVDITRRHAMADFFWIASARRPDLATCVLHDDSRKVFKTLLPTEDIKLVETFLSTVYAVIDRFYTEYRVPKPKAGETLFFPCKITDKRGTAQTFNLASLVPGFAGTTANAHLTVSDPKFDYYCTWCFNRREGANVKLEKCSKCLATRYCRPECKTAHWKNGHSIECKPLVVGDLLK